MTATVPPFSASSRIADSTASTRALPWTPGRAQQLPAHEAARLHAHVLQGHREQPGGDLLAACDDHVIFGRIVERRGLAAQLHQPVGLPGHRRHHDQHLVARLRPRARTRPATLRMRSMPAIDVPPNFITMRGIGLLGLARRGLLGDGAWSRQASSRKRSSSSASSPPTGGTPTALGDAAQAQSRAPQIHPRLDRPALAVRRAHPHAARGQDRARRRLRRRAAGGAAGEARRQGHRHRRRRPR